MEKIMETDGTRNGEKMYCPINEWDCPYYKGGICHKRDPEEECSEFLAIYGVTDYWWEAP